MLRVILPLCRGSHQTELYCSNYIFYFTIFFYLVLLHQILAEWIAIKRPNSSHVIPISLEITILLLVDFLSTKRFIIIKEMDCLSMLFSMGVQNLW
jgi:hypothetical protein